MLSQMPPIRARSTKTKARDDIKTFPVLISTEHEIPSAFKLKSKHFLCFNHLSQLFSLLINVKLSNCWNLNVYEQDNFYA